MIYLILSLFLKISPPRQNNAGYINHRRGKEDYSNISLGFFTDEDYEENYIFTESENPKIYFRECLFSNVVPRSYSTSSSLIYAIKSQNILLSNNFTQCSFTNSLINVNEGNLTMEYNQILSCYDFSAKLSIGNIIRCTKIFSNIQFNTITFDNTSYSCRGLYFSQCPEILVTNLTITNANIPRNRGNAIFLTTESDEKVECKVEGCDFIDCGESDYVIYSTLRYITITKSSIVFSELPSQKVGGIYFPFISSYTITYSKFVNIPGDSVTFSNDERIIRPFSIKVTYSTFTNCNKCIHFKLTGDQLTLTNVTLDSNDFDKTLIDFEANTEIINFTSCRIASCPSSRDNFNYVFDIPDNNREFNFDECIISSSHFSSSRRGIYFSKTGRYTFHKTNIINMDLGLYISDEDNDESSQPLEVEILDDSSFLMCTNCIVFNIRNSPITNILINNIIFATDLIKFNNTLKSATLELCNFKKCFSSYQGTSIIELPNSDEFEFVMDRCIFDFANLLSGTAIEIGPKIKSVTIDEVQFIDIQGDIFIDIDKSQFVEIPDPIRITNCSFLKSTSSLDGAAIHISSYCGSRLFEIIDCRFEGCDSKNSNGAISFNAAYGIIQRCKFIDNIASKYADIYYSVDANFDKYFLLDNHCLTIEKNNFIHNLDSKTTSLCFLSFEQITRYKFIKNNIFINQTLDNIYLFSHERNANISKGRILMISNCIAESNKDKLIPSSLSYKIEYESSFSCFTEYCPQFPDGSIEFDDPQKIENEENKLFTSCDNSYDLQIIIHNSILSVYDCLFTLIRTRTNKGGAIYILADKEITNEFNKPVEIHNCTFHSCSNEFGGAVFIKSTASSLQFDIRDSKFISNEADSNGASIYIDSLFINIENCIFKQNKAMKDGGAIYYEFGGDLPSRFSLLEEGTIYALQVVDCKFTSNVAESRGGAILASLKKEVTEGMIDINRCQFDSCESKTNGGGGIYLDIKSAIEGQVFAQFNTFKNCKAPFGGGMCIFSDILDNIIYITNSIFQKNVATGNLGGSGVYLVALNASVTDCEFFNNIGKGSMKISENVEKFKRTVLSENSVNMLSVSNCLFEIDANSSCSIYYVQGENQTIPVNVKNCIFNGKLAKEAHHIEGVSKSKTNKKQMLLVESCKFSSDKSKAISSSKDDFASFDFDKQIFNFLNEQNIQKSSKNYSIVMIEVLIPVVFVAVVVTNFLKKNENLNNNDEVDI